MRRGDEAQRAEVKTTKKEARRHRSHIQTVFSETTKPDSDPRPTSADEPHELPAARGLVSANFQATAAPFANQKACTPGTAVYRPARFLRRTEAALVLSTAPVDKNALIVDFAWTSAAGPRCLPSRGRDNAVAIAFPTHLRAKKEAEEDTPRTSNDKNIIVISSPSIEGAKAYNNITTLKIKELEHQSVDYATPPEQCTKGVIHNIPSEESKEMISRSLVNKRNPTILQARRMGKTNSVVIVFEGEKVPYFVYYRTTE
ncbi:hypothetical protein HPB48_001766 [Haemaphysalis longicornis]|uniref:Uncharacterized protein n=1 Tax=Haemaphysalis longicornis TaxID=44386 RepID=A0A9J6GM02_HAELO|nr:hypothetical protein HPB48_001766 [Haemaphysalis longicornis]